MRNKYDLRRNEAGQVLILAIIIMMLTVLIIPTTLGLTYSNGQTINIRTERMQVLYAADTGVQDALYVLDNLGNGTHWKVPGAIGTETSYPLTAKESGLDVDVGVTIYKDGNGTYLVTSTASNWEGRKATVRVHVHQATTQKAVGPIYEPGEGNVSTSPFDYAIASLGSAGPDFKTNPPTISGDVFSNGPVDFGSGSIVQSDGIHAGNVWAKGTVTLESGVNVSGSVHAEGDIILFNGASIGGSAYATDSIQATGSGSKIWGGAGAYGAINVQNTSGVGNSSVGYGDIQVSGPISSWGFNVGGNVASNQDITVDNNGKIMGDASAAGAVTEASGGDVQGTITQGAPPVTLTLTEVPTLVAQDVPYWQNLYKTEAQAGGTIFGDYSPPNGDVYLGPKYITGNVDMKNATVLHLTGTVYVEGWVSIKSKANIVGNGKLVAVGNIELFNKLIGDPRFDMPLLMTLACFIMQNNGDLYAALYAPNCSIDVQNWNTVTGTVVGQSIIGGQGFTVNWDSKVRNIPGLPGGNVTESNGTWIPVEQPPIIEYTGVVMDYYTVCDDETCQ